jgi:hypothetical protein
MVRPRFPNCLTIRPLLVALPTDRWHRRERLISEMNVEVSGRGCRRSLPIGYYMLERGRRARVLLPEAAAIQFGCQLRYLAERGALMHARVWSELKWFVASFVIPIVALIGLDVAFSTSPLPVWRRLLTLEDTCSYGYCFILPAFLAVVTLCARVSVKAFRHRREMHRNTPSRPLNTPNDRASSGEPPA